VTPVRLRAGPVDKRRHHDISRVKTKSHSTKAARRARRLVVGWFALLSVPWVLGASWLVFAMAGGHIPRALYGGAALAVCGCIGWLGVRPVLSGIDKVDRERSTLREQFDRARMGSMSDSLTGLGNLRAFMDELDLQINAADGGRRMALICADVDNLKSVNELRGHVGGDAVLRGAAHILAANMRRWDHAFRLGGDEFAVVLLDCSPEDGVMIARRMLSAALEGGVGGNNIVPGGFSLTFGVSAFPSPARTRDELIGQADAAVHFGKDHGRTEVNLFDPRLHAVILGARQLEEQGAALLKVAQDRAMTPVYQPIYNLRTGKVMGYEGLVRPKPETGFANPGVMFHAAEVCGRTVELDMASLEVVMKGAVGLPELLYLSINLSPRTLETESFSPYEVLSIASRYGINPSRILVELTEREAIKDLDRLRDAFATMRKYGVRTAADDVGEGNSGLRLLAELPFDVMKIDLTLVRKGVLSKTVDDVLHGLGEIAKRRNMTVVAEGIETPEHLDSVISRGFGAGQGYLLKRPGPLLDAMDLDLDLLLGRDYADAGAILVGQS